jgi:probable FeS assembly SUF system protein SufT
MHQREEITLQRDVAAIQIPDGTPILLTEGTPLLLTQQLGGSFTVMNDRGAMFRIEESHADALGKEVEDEAGAAGSGSLEDRVWAQMKKCYDPEIPVNIVDLGLVYDCRIDAGADESSVVDVKMTLTAPGCGMGPVLADDVKRRIEGLPGVSEARVEVVFDPPWNQNMMSEAARLQLGFM